MSTGTGPEARLGRKPTEIHWDQITIHWDQISIHWDQITIHGDRQKQAFQQNANNDWPIKKKRLTCSLWQMVGVSQAKTGW